MLLKHSPSGQLPSIDLIKDEMTRKFGIDLTQQLLKYLRNIYDDLMKVVPEVVDTLPTAGVDYYQRFFIKHNTGADDTVHICIWDDNASAYKWQQITLT